MYDSHALFLHRFFVPNDVRHTILSYGDLTALYPLANDIRGAFVCAGLLVHGIDLLLEVLNLLTLQFDLAFVLVVDSLHDLLHLELFTHISLCPPPLATRFEDVNTSALCCYEYERTPKVRLNAIMSEDVLTADVGRVSKRCSNLWVHRDHEVSLLCKRIIAILHLLRHPLSKAVTAERIDQIYDPLPWQFGYISYIWQKQLEPFRLSTKVKDGIDGESLVHGHVQMLYTLRFEDYRHVGE